MKDNELTLSQRVFILSAGSVTGQKEKNGPLGKLFDISGDDKFGKDTWEKSEAEMQRLALRIALNKSGISENHIDALFAGDLINQCISSSFGLISFNIPFFCLLYTSRLVEIAKAEGADAIAHGCTGKGNDQVRFELAIKAFAPDMTIIAPWRVWNIKSRDEEIDYAEAHHIPLKINRETNYSKDKNLWHLSHEGLDLSLIHISRAVHTAAISTPSVHSSEVRKRLPVVVFHIVREISVACRPFVKRVLRKRQLTVLIQMCIRDRTIILRS